MKKLLLGLALTSALVSFADIRAVSSIQWGGGEKSWQYGRHQQKMQLVAKGGAKVVFIGDSITHFWEGGGKAAWAKFFPDALNLGTSADRTEHVLWRIDNGELDGYEAKCIVIMIGTNNTGHFPIEKEPPVDTILGIREVIKRVQQKQPKAKIVLCSIFPRGSGINDGYRKRNNIVNAEISKFCDGKNIFWCDFSDQYLMPDGTLPRTVMSDLLHPGPYGYEVWAAAVKPFVDYALSNGALPVPPNRYPSFIVPGTMNANESTPVYPTTRIDSLNAWWLTRMLDKRNIIANSKGEFDLVFVGDSITHNWERNKRAKEILTKLGETYSVLTLGYGGDRTENVLWRMKYGELDGYKAKCFMVMIGTNNSGGNPTQIARGIKEILATIQAKQPEAKILLLPIFPRGESAENKGRKCNEAVNKIIKGYADGSKILWVDFNDKLVDEKGDTLKLMKDRLHPDAEGYDIWLNAVAPYFKQVVGK